MIRKIILAFFLICFVTVSFGQRKHHITTDVGKIFYEVHGDGIPILFLSGGPGAPPQTLNPIIDYLKDNYKCILLHQRGTGDSYNSKIDSTTITIDRYVSDISAVAKQERIEKFYLLGHSWGAMLALDYIVKYPDKVNGAILIGSSGCSLDFLQPMNNRIFSAVTKNEMDSLQAYSVQLNNDKIENWSKNELLNKINSIIISKQFYDLSFVPELLKYGSINREVNILMMANLRNINWNLENQLKEIKISTVIINGNNDPIGIEPVQKLKEIMVGSELCVINDCGHYVWLEKPNELKSIVFNFLNKIAY